MCTVYILLLDARRSLRSHRLCSVSLDTVVYPFAAGSCLRNLCFSTHSPSSANANESMPTAAKLVPCLRSMVMELPGAVD
jgi:hypothetical protein